jgi:hypothetical protein
VVRDGDGLVRLVVAKDRPGHVRRVAFERKTAAEVATRSEKDVLTVTLTTPSGHGRDSDWRPTGLMERLSMWLERNPGANLRLVEASVTGKGPSIREALKFLVADGHAVIDTGPRGAHQYRITKAYREQSA